jgi:16S rRNA (adenine1518-N6/adenine1519-N6)-dimethyltransferase
LDPTSRAPFGGRPAEVHSRLVGMGHIPSRRLGQNFVIDANTIERTIGAARVELGDRVVEIGPGLGPLTVPLARAGARVLAVEADPSLASELSRLVAGQPITVLRADAAKLDWVGNLASLGPPPYKLVAHLPYNIATSLILDVLAQVSSVSELTVMVQLEVAQRLVAVVGDDAYGAVSVKRAYFASADIVARVPPTVFRPRPRVMSALVRIVRREDRRLGPSAEYRCLVALVNAGFGQRRKMLRGSLRALVTGDHFTEAGIDPCARAEELNLDQWQRLAEVVGNRA